MDVLDRTRTDSQAVVPTGTGRAAVWPGRLERAAPFLLLALVTAYTLVYTLASIGKYNAYGMGFDLALYEQQIWNTANGRWFETSIFSFTNSALGADLQLIEAPLALAYALVPSVFTLLFIQSLALALGAVPLFALARRQLGAAWPGLALALAYLVYPVVVNTNLYELRLRSFAVAPLLFALYCLETRRLRGYYLGLGIALLCRTDIGLSIAVVGLYALWRRRGPGFWLVPVLAGVGWVLLGVFVIVPRLSSGAPYLFTSIYYNLGSTPAEIALTLLTRPLYVLEQVVTPGKLEYLNGLFLPLVYLPLLNPPALLMAAPTLALNLLSPTRLHWDLVHGYSILVVPFFFFAAVPALAWLRERAGRFSILDSNTRPNVVLGLALSAVVLASLAFNVADGSAAVRWLRRPPSPRVALVRSFAAMFPADAPLAASSLVAPVLPPRRALYYFPGNQSYGASNVDLAQYLLVDTQGANEQVMAALARYRGDARWHVLREENGLVLLERHQP